MKTKNDNTACNCYCHVTGEHVAGKVYRYYDCQHCTDTKEDKGSESETIRNLEERQSIKYRRCHQTFEAQDPNEMEGLLSPAFPAIILGNEEIIQHTIFISPSFSSTS